MSHYDYFNEIELVCRQYYFVNVFRVKMAKLYYIMLADQSRQSYYNNMKFNNKKKKNNNKEESVDLIIFLKMFYVGIDLS